MSTPSTRQRTEESKKKWKDLTDLLEAFQKDLEKWVIDKVHPKTEDATNLLSENLADRKPRHELLEALDVLESNKTAYKKKLKNLEKLVEQLYDEIQHAPPATDREEEDSVTTRQFQYKKLEEKVEISQNAFTSWDNQLMRIKINYKERTKDLDEIDPIGPKVELSEKNTQILGGQRPYLVT